MTEIHIEHYINVRSVTHSAAHTQVTSMGIPAIGVTLSP